ncbi:hypothetical protein N9D92_02535 [Gammaproteobacteria bacterium]|nr:hypothetical protein [Gammaproteobacteria bacterium]
MNQIWTMLVKLFFIAFAISCLGFAVAFFLFEIEIENFLIAFFSFNEQASKFKYIVTPQKVLMISAIVFIATLIGIYKITYIKEYLTRELFWFLAVCKDVILSTLRIKTGILIVLPAAVLLTLASTFTVTYDEALSYSMFISRGPLISIAYYPVPNNHIFFSLLSSLLTSLISLDPILIMRLLSIFSFIISFFFIYKFLTLIVSKEASTLISAVYIVMPFSIYYGFLGRGYSLLLLIFFTCTYIIFLQIAENKQTLKIGVFSILSAIGIFTIPTYIYAFLVNIVFILLFSRSSSFQPIAKSMILTFGISTVFYSPAIIFSGLDAIVGNEYVESKNRVHLFYKLPSFIFETFVIIFNSKPFAQFFLFSILIIAIKYFSKYRAKMDKIILTLFFVPILLIVLQGVQPPPRVFFFWYSLAILPFYIFLYNEQRLFKFANPFLLAICIQVIVLTKTFGFPQTMIFNDPFAAKYSSIIAEDKISILSSVDHMNTFLLYEKSINNYQDMRVQYQEKVTEKDKKINYDWIILNSGEPTPLNYQEIYNENGWVFFRNQ